MLKKLRSDGLVGFHGVSTTINFGARKQIDNRCIKLMIILALTTLLHAIQAYNISGLSLILSLQHSNEIYRLIKRNRQNYKILTKAPWNVEFSRSCFKALLIIDSLLWLFELISLSGDVHTNSGPNSVNTDDSVVSSLSHDSLQE